jgi:hypothetical protein
MVKYRTIELHGRRVVLLCGIPDPNNRESGQVEAVDKLLQTANENPDAVAFAYLAGRWVAAA